MLGYATMGTNDLARSAKFYDAIAAITGAGRVFETDRVVTWGTPEKGAMIGVIKPHDEQPATGGNGTMFGLPVESEEQVQQIHAHALANGGSDEGPPGPRGEAFYAAYFRDPDGNKLVAYVPPKAP
ncbi:VOC family protein [Alteraurantiacibacter aestuarii]|uniref:VOC family protein n=1 Tax=Alteraurantiacibacter aestuarii TaxID=650004 RepID=A0A844ZM30_9SPHN|nr:VOC family protein [Alteraurantiacibacter aestuarii]MXO88372.1 VOC family protein [Alteraurantiacibacter aestuarii]